MRFDFIAARQEGYSDDEIADFLAKENGFDIGAARAEGYKTSEILEFLAEPPLRRLPAAEEPVASGDPQFPDPYGAEPAKRASSVLEGVVMPEPKFDPAEGERLSRRAANEPQQPRRQLPGADMRQGREVEPRSAARAVTDTVLGLGQGAVGMVKGVADNIDAGDNAVSRTLDKAVQGLEYFKSDELRDQAVKRDALIYTVQKNQGELAAARAALNSIALFPAATGDVAARGAGSLIPTVGMGVAGLGPASMWATNALANAGDAASQTADALRRLPPSEWQNDERYLSLLKDGQTHEQAVATLAPIYALPAQALGGLTGFLSGRTGLERVIAGRGVGAGMRARVGAAGAEALGEQAETLVPQAAGNLIVGSVDQTTGLTDSLGRAAVDTAIGSAPGSALAASAPVRTAQPVTAPIAAIAPAQTTDEAIMAAAQALDSQPVAEQAVANIERILGEPNVSTAPAVPGGDTAAAGGGLDLAAPGVGAGVGNDGGAVPAVDTRGPAAEFPAADLPQPAGPDLDALRGDNAALRAQALQALEAQQVAAAPADAVPATRGDEPAAQLPVAGSAPVEAGGVAPAATPAVQVTRRNNGTVVLKGDTQQILAALATQGLTGIPGNAGVIVARSQAQQAATLFQQPEAAPDPAQQRAEFQAAEEGFLPPGSRDDRALYDLISRAMRGERVTPQYAQGVVEQEMETANRARFEDYLQADPLLPDDIEDAIQDVTSDPALEAELRALLAAAADEGIDTEAVLEKAAQIAENGNQDEYTRQAIADVSAARASRGDAAARARAEQGRPAAQRAGREAGQPDPGQPDPGQEGDQQVLTAPTRADIEAQQDRAASAETRDQREQVRLESEAGAGLFELTQEEGRRDTTGNLFDQPEETPSPATEKPVSQMSAADLLRAAADKMEGKAESASADGADTQTAFFEKALEAAKSGSETLSNFFAGKTLLSEIDYLLNVPSNASSGEQTTNAVDGFSSTSKGRFDSVRRDAQALRNIIKSKAFLDKGFRGINAKTQRLVFSHVLRLIGENQVRQIVVELVPVDVVNDLSRAQFTPDGFLNNPTVFKEALSGSLASPVALRSNFADSLVRAIAYAGAKVSSGSVLPDLERPPKNGSSAVRTADGDFRHRGDDTRNDGETEQGVAMYARAGLDAAAFRRAFGAPERMDVDRVQQIVDELTASWDNGPAFEIVATAADMPGGRHPSDARGLIQNGTAYIVAANNPTRDAVARTLGHEAIGHYGLWKMLGEDGTRQFQRNVQLALASGNKPLNAIRDKVRELYVDERGKFNLSPEQEADEIAAFAVEDGIDPVTGEFRPGFGFLKSVWAKIAAFLRDTLGLPVSFTNVELQGLLVQSMRGLQVGQRLEGGADVLVAAARDQSPEGKALQALSENDDLFALPKSDKTTVEEIAAENDPDIKVRQTKIVNETLYTLTMPSGETAKLWVRPANPSGEQIYSMDLVDGDTSNVETGRPGENPEDVDPAVDDVYLDVSNLKPGQAGVKAYNIAATFAHNTGRIFIGDPSGLSDIAMRRRLENMISTALKFGTTDHIAPHPRQVKGDAKLGIPPLKWVYGDSLGNIRRMIDISLRLDETGALPKYDYDTATGTFHPRQVEGDRLPGDQRPAAGQVRPVSERDGQAPAPGGSGVSGNDRGKPVAGDAYAAGGGLPAVPSAYGKRSTTLARAAIFRALLREAGEGGSGAQRGRDGLLAGLVRVANQYPGATKGIFYARGPAGAGQPGVTPPAGTPPATPTTSSKPGNAWSLPPDTRTDRIIYDLQDGRVDLKRVQQAIKDAGNQIDELWDARLAETLYPGRVAHRSKQFLDAEVKPLLQAMALNKVEMDELSDYLHARGAEERNAQIAKVNPDMPDGGAGKNSKGVLMTNQAAKAYLATIGQTRKAVLDSLAKRVDAITSGTRKLLVSEGLEKQETIDAWEAAYKNYVPMFRDEAESGAPHPQGMGFAVKGSASRRATGSTKQVTNMLAHVLMQREAAITRAEKNHVAMALYGLALSNPNPEFWTTIRPSMSDAKITAELQAMGVDPATAALGMERAPTIRTVDEATGKVVDRPNPMYRNLPGAITLKVNGEDRVLMLNVQDVRGQRLAENLKNLDGLTRIDIAGSIVGKTTRWLAAVNTQYNPVFGLKNVVRDVLGGTINLGSTALRGNALKVLRDTTPAMQGIARELAMPGKGGTWGKLWQQFQEDGGKTGWKENWRDPQERARAIEAELKAASSAGKLTPGKAAHAIFDLLDGFNTTLENSVRLSAYKAALDKGMSRAEAARLGRELTVDFNRKGRAGREVSPIYAFFNASVQGTARFIETIKGPTGKYVIPGGLALGVIQALMLAAAGYEEDEIPEFEKARGFIIPIGLNEEGKRAHIIIPISLGFHAIPNTGRILTEMVLSGGKDFGAKSFKALAEVAAAMNPLGGGDVTTLPGALTTVAPTVIDPLLELGFNKNFAGNPIEREKFRETDTRPGAARVKESTQRSTTGQAYLGISEAINAMTGGTKYEAGVISPTPERLRYLAQTVGGGVLRETEKIINGLTSTEPVKPNQIPVVGSFYGEVDNEQVQASRYFRNKEKTESVQSSFKAMEKAGDGKAMKTFMKDHPEILAAEIMGEVQRDIDELNKLAVTVIANPKLMAEIDARRTKLMTSANAKVKKLEDMQAKKQGTGPTLGEKLRSTQKAAEPVN